MKLLTLDVGANFIKWALIDSRYKILREGRSQTPQDSLDGLLKEVEVIVNGLTDTEFDGMAFSLPGGMDPETGYITHGGKLTYLNNISFFDEITERFNKRVSIENDARCAAFAEMRMGTLRGVKNGLALMLGTGLGGAIIINGDLYRGTNHYAGDFSYIATGKSESNPKGIIANEIGAPHLIRRVSAAVQEELDGEQLMALVESGNQEAILIYDDYIQQITQLLVSLQFIFACEKIVLGGGLSQSDYLINSLKKSYNDYMRGFFLKVPYAKLERCRYSGQANLIGAAAFFWSRHGFL